jgi:hypothetical protein
MTREIAANRYWPFQLLLSQGPNRECPLTARPFREFSASEMAGREEGGMGSEYGPF